MSIYEKIPYTHVEGADTGHSIRVYALTTCGFCKRALAHLAEKKIAYSYVYIDELAADIKQELKETLRETHQRNLVYPFLVVDEKVAITGFEKAKWDTAVS